MVRRRPEFRPMPIPRRPQSRRRYRRHVLARKEFGRFYGRFKNYKNEIKGFEFEVVMNKSYSPELKGQLIKVLCDSLLRNQIPEHKAGQVFPSVGYLLRVATWIRVRKLLSYEAGVRYEQ